MSSEATSRELTTKTSLITTSRLDWLPIAIGAIILVTLQTGCGSADGPVRIPVTGKVNLDDVPLSSGVIRFVPVDDAGGPGAATKIVAGEFEFSSDNGPVIANHRVEIEATDFQDFAIDDEAAFAAAAEATGKSPVAVNPVPAIYNSRSTLTLPLTLPMIEPVTHALPALPHGITSFGAAIVGSDVYVYGGHFGAAHHYSESGQSNEFRRISLAKPETGWEPLPGGPKLTGLAMVEYGGKLYRVGGFTVKNADDQDQSLWSQDSFASFDPATGTWTDLTPLPEGRSSHDAAVLDGKLYVVGGWNMAGADSTTWHKTAWVCDLTQGERKWTALPEPPFQRRAVSLAARGDRLYVIGGMQEDGGPTTQVAVFDPSAQIWSTAPALHGHGMEGFGTSAFAIGDRLVVTTMSGSVQTLSDDGTEWTLAGQANEPRFFHRQLTTNDGRILVVGGASMTTGKTNSVELMQFVAE